MAIMRLSGKDIVNDLGELLGLDLSADRKIVLTIDDGEVTILREGFIKEIPKVEENV